MLRTLFVERGVSGIADNHPVVVAPAKAGASDRATVQPVFCTPAFAGMTGLGLRGDADSFKRLRGRCGLHNPAYLCRSYRARFGGPARREPPRAMNAVANQTGPVTLSHSSQPRSCTSHALRPPAA